MQGIYVNVQGLETKQNQQKFDPAKLTNTQ